MRQQSPLRSCEDSGSCGRYWHCGARRGAGSFSRPPSPEEIGWIFLVVLGDTRFPLDSRAAFAQLLVDRQAPGSTGGRRRPEVQGDLRK